MLTSLKVALKIAVRGQLRASRVTCSSAHLFSSLINAKDGKACAKPEYSQCWREYLPTAAEVILLLHHHHTFLKKDLPLANYFMQMEIDFFCLSCFQVSQLTQ